MSDRPVPAGCATENKHRMRSGLAAVVAAVVVALGASLTPTPAAAQQSPNDRLIDDASKDNLGNMRADFADGADVNARDESGMTALMNATIFGQTEAARLLLEHGADLNAKDNDGGALLRTAAQNGYMDLTRLFLERGADVNAKDDDGVTPLIVAVAAGKAEVDLLRLLLERGADVNAKTDDGVTALGIAAKYGRSDIAALLRAHGAK